MATTPRSRLPGGFLPKSKVGQEPVTASTLGPPVQIEGKECGAQPLSFLLEVNVMLAGSLDAESVLGDVLVSLVESENLSRASFYRLNEVTGKLRPVASRGRKVGSPRTISLQEATVLGCAVKQKESIYIPRTAEDPRCLGFEPEERCYLAVPLRTTTRTLGVLEAVADEPESIRPLSRILIDQVATQTALALERGELYRQLRASEERFKAIFEQASFGVAVVRLDGKIHTVNPAYARLLASAREELQGKNLLDYVHPQDVPAAKQQLQSFLDAGSGRVSFETRYRPKSGDSGWCAAHLSLLHEGGNNPTHLLVIVQDIDERKKADEEYRRLQQQLFQAQKMEALGTLAGGIAHDFNNLLSVMLGFASLARQRLSTDHPLQDSLGMIEQSAEHAADLTRQLLAFSRPDQQQVKPVSVDAVLERVRRMVARTFNRNITVNVQKGGEALWISAVPSFLEQALLNMCINARDAMPQGGTLTLEATTTVIETGPTGLVGTGAPGCYASISVQDTGTGIAPETSSRVFEPFFTTKEPGRGTGLGLAMVYGFVKNHNGFVNVSSEPGHGARFTILLPLIPPPAPQVREGGLGQIAPGCGTILVVDDEPMVRAFAVEGLKGLGYRVYAAENGKQALQIFEQHRDEIDCVLMDLIMPESGGVETFRRMRALDPLVKVVFASGYSTGEILGDAPDARAVAFIGKPYTLEGLSIVLRKAGAGPPRCV